MIIINGVYFDTVGLSEVDTVRRPASMTDGITGSLISTQARWVRWRMDYSLSVDRAQKQRLQALFANTNGPFDFIDHRGFSWLKDAGTDDDTHAYETGAYFLAGVDLNSGAPAQGNGERACGQNWQIPVTIIPNARALNGDSASIPGPTGGEMQPPETPGGTINGVNDTFTTAESYEFILLFRNGQEMKLASDYTYSGSTITFLPGQIPQTGDQLDCFGVL